LLLVALAIKLFRTLRSDKTGQNRDQYDSLAILKTRYARGEIGDEEFYQNEKQIVEVAIITFQ